MLMRKWLSYEKIGLKGKQTPIADCQVSDRETEIQKSGRSLEAR